MGPHKKEMPRINVINPVDGVHLSTMLAKIVKVCKIPLQEIDALIKVYTEEIHADKITSTKAKSNTASNLNALARRALTKDPISFCNMITLVRILKIDSLTFTINIKRNGEEHEIQHEVKIKDVKPKSDLW